jgi:mRNA interferase MazF
MSLGSLLPKRGEIYLVPSPPPVGTGEAAASKVRPVLILQNDRDNQNPRHPTITVAPITTHGVPGPEYDTDVVLSASATGLQRDSKALLGQIMTIRKSLLGRCVGRLDDETMDDVETALLIALGVIEPA